MSSIAKGKPSWRAWFIWGCVSLFYLYEYILRASPSVMTHDLMRDFHVTSAGLGVLTSFYYYAYFILQIPCGIIVDWIGVKRVITLSCILCFIGSYLFGESDSLAAAQVGRFLIGAGSAAAFLSCLKVSADWFPPHYFVMMAGLSNMMGTLGGTFGGAPMALLVDYTSWRHSMLILAIIGAILSVICWFSLKDNHTHPVTKDTLKKFNRSLVSVIKEPQAWVIALFSSFFYVPISAFAELWGVPFLMKQYAVSNTLAASASVMVFVGMAVGGPLFAWASNKLQSRRHAMLFGGILSLVAFLTAIFVPISLVNMHFVLFLAGLGVGAQVLGFTCIQESHTIQMSGTVVGFNNAVVMFSGVFFQPFLGSLLDWLWDGKREAITGVAVYSIENYQVAMLAIPLSIFMALLLIFFLKETFPKTPA